MSGKPVLATALVLRGVSRWGTFFRDHFIEFIDEILHVLKLSVHAGKTDEGHLVESTEVLHHHLAKVGPFYVDYTARQFDPRAQFQVITSDRLQLLEHWARIIEPYSPSAY